MILERDFRGGLVCKRVLDPVKSLLLALTVGRGDQIPFSISLPHIISNYHVLPGSLPLPQMLQIQSKSYQSHLCSSTRPNDFFPPRIREARVVEDFGGE